jgi:DNA-binding protein
MAEKSNDVIFVGNKPPMSYVLAIITAFSSGIEKEIRSRFIKELKVTKIAIGTAEMPPREGENRSRMVSTIEITLTKA